MFSFINRIGKCRYFSLACLVSLFMTALAACGGGSSGGGSNNTAPTAAITSPLDEAIYTYGDTITFTGSGTDDEDGELSGASLVWTSDLDGSVRTGASFTLSDLSWGDHTITLTATDSNAETGSDSIYLSVKAWSHPADITDDISPDGWSATYPRVAMDGDGNAVIAWFQPDGSYYQIFKCEYRSGQWTYPVDPTDNISPDGGNAFYPQVAMDGNGNAVIVWCQSDGSNTQIFMSEYN